MRRRNATFHFDLPFLGKVFTKLSYKINDILKCLIMYLLPYMYFFNVIWCISDDKKSYVMIAAALGSLLLFITVVVGVIYYKVKSNNAR